MPGAGRRGPAPASAIEILDRDTSLRPMADSFVINVTDAHAWEHPVSGVTIDFDKPKAPFRDTGINIIVLQPGQPSCKSTPRACSELAARYNASTPEPTDTGDVAYSDWPWDPKGATPAWPPT